MKRTPWVERKFKLNAPEGWIYNIITRLEGAVPRLNHITRGISVADASHQKDNKWSIKEHIGHLYDLEFLHIERLQQLQQHIPVLTAADMSNERTAIANHNENSISKLISLFEGNRREFVQGLANIDDETAKHKALHSRLNIYMRPVDLAEFTAEHDDHHLCSIALIREKLRR